MGNDGSLWGWGYAPLGDGGRVVQIGTGYTAVALGTNHGLALEADGTRCHRLDGPTLVPGAHAPTRTDPPVKREDPAQPWTPAQRASVMHQCETAFPGEGICACFTHQVELLSPDPDVVTSEAIQSGLKRCRRV